jgi:hypothetical protein
MVEGNWCSVKGIQLITSSSSSSVGVLSGAQAAVSNRLAAST